MNIKKRGFGMIFILIVGFVLIGLLFLTWFFFIKEKAVYGGPLGDPREAYNISFVRESVIINQTLNSLLFIIEVSNSLENISGFKVELLDNERKSYVEAFAINHSNSKYRKLKINYTSSGMIMPSVIIVEPIFAFAKNPENYIKKESYKITEEDITRANCNNDGIIDFAEKCDDGNFNDGDDCLTDCSLPFCGDGFLWNSGTGKEECEGDNFGKYGAGKIKCLTYESSYFSGDLRCVNCRINLTECKKSIKAIYLNGINNSMDISVIRLRDNESYSFSFWIKHAAIDSNPRAIIECQNTYISLISNNNRYIFRTYLNNNISREINVPTARAGVWEHVVAISEMSHSKIYINGELRDAQANFGKIYGDKLKCYIGARYDKTGFFNGTIDDFRIYNKALEAREIVKIYEGGQNDKNEITKLLAWWKLDEKEGSIAKDYSNNSYNAILVNNPIWIEEEEMDSKWRNIVFDSISPLSEEIENNSFFIQVNSSKSNV